MSHPPRAARGFTVIELLVTVAILGVLSSIALPQFARATARTRATERATVLNALKRAITDTVVLRQRLPANPWVAAANPPGAPGPGKRAIDWTLPGWRDLPLFVEGACYYSYQFVAQDAADDGRDVTLTVVATGDLDGDGFPSTKTMLYRGRGYSFELVSETPPAGQEDRDTF